MGDKLEMLQTAVYDYCLDLAQYITGSKQECYRL